MAIVRYSVDPKFELARVRKLVRQSIRKLHNSVAVHYLRPLQGNLEFTVPSLASARKLGHSEAELRFLTKEVMDILHQLKRDIEHDQPKPQTTGS